MKNVSLLIYIKLETRAETLNDHWNRVNLKSSGWISVRHLELVSFETFQSLSSLCRHPRSFPFEYRYENRCTATGVSSLFSRETKRWEGRKKGCKEKQRDRGTEREGEKEWKRWLWCSWRTTIIESTHPRDSRLKSSNLRRSLHIYLRRTDDPECRGHPEELDSDGTIIADGIKQPNIIHTQQSACLVTTRRNEWRIVRDTV